MIRNGVRFSEARRGEKGKRLGLKRRTCGSRFSASKTLATMPFASSLGLGVHRVRIVLLEEGVRQDHGARLQSAVQTPMLQQEVHNMGSESADRSFLDGDQRLMFVGKSEDEFDIERLGEPRIGDGRRKTKLGEFVCSFVAFGQPRPKRQQRDVVSLADYASPSDLERLRNLRNGRPHALSARIAYG